MLLVLVRALFPNWNFFDRVSFNFEIYFKVPDSIRWEVISFEQKRQLLGLFFNADLNLTLAQINIIEHFAQDIQELQNINPLIHSKDVKKLTTFKMICSLIRIKLKDYELESSAIQFKIVACKSDEKIDLYVSEWLDRVSL